MYVFCLHAMYMHHMSVWCSGRKSNPLGLEVTDGCGPLWGHQKSHQGSCVRVIYSPNCWAISPGPQNYKLKIIKKMFIPLKVPLNIL